MSLSLPTSAIKITDVSTSPQQVLGTLVLEPPNALTGQGGKTWIYVQVVGSAAVAGNVLSRQAGATAGSDTYVVLRSPTGTPGIRVVGVAQHEIPENSYGFILREGIGEVLADTQGIDVNEAVIVGAATAGRAEEAQASVQLPIAYALEDAAAGALATCRIVCQG